MKKRLKTNSGEKSKLIYLRNSIIFKDYSALRNHRIYTDDTTYRVSVDEIYRILAKNYKLSKIQIKRIVISYRQLER
jgi:hypothetical protein